jgi:eukaryotic-like serine/threonine-protein kinase
VAIKFLARHLVSSEAAKARFLREAQAASALDHPNIATVYDIGEEDGEIFIVMALYEGETLKQCLQKGRLTVGQALAILRQVTLGLEAAHRAGIVHRDIKPANILIGSSGTVKILDFGLAKLLYDSQADTMTQAGQAIGTVLYMSPEQLGGEAVDQRSDLWSLGVVAYEVLAGVSPFQSDSLAATTKRIVNDEPPSLDAHPGVPAWLAQLISALLRKNPAERLQSATEVLRWLQDGNASYPTEVRTAPFAPTRRDKQVAQSRAALVFAAGVLVATAAWWGLRNRIRSHGADADRSIAVLPFASLSVGEENAYFAQGFHDELLRQVARIGDLRVISRTSVQQYREGARNLREIAEALGVSSIVEGSVQRAGNRVRVEARLIDAHGDRQIWADRYDRDVSDAFAIQTAVAEEIAGALHTRLSAAQKAQFARRPTDSPEAYDLYLRALEYANRPGHQPQNLTIAERLLRQAIAADPSFALARARLAFTRIETYWFVAGTPDSVAEEAKEESEHALRLRPDLPEAHLAMGAYYYWGWRDYEAALPEFEIARRGLPAEAINLIGAVRRRQGRFDEAIRDQQEAAQLDPRSPGQLLEVAISLLLTRRYEEADSAMDHALTIAPDFAGASMLKAVIHEAWKEESDLARAVLRQTRGRLDPRGRVGQQDWFIMLLEHHPAEALPLLDSAESDSIITPRGVYPKALLYAGAHEALGDAAQARQEYESARSALEAQLEKNPGRGPERMLLARAYAGLGRKEDALREARRAVEALPISKDAFFGSDLEIYRAAVEGRVGEADAAIEHIRQLLSVPCLLSPALLRIDPRWAPLWGDPRFKQLAKLDR